MKLTIDDLGKTYRLCMSTGSVKEKSTDIELIKSLKIVAEKGLEFMYVHSIFKIPDVTIEGAAFPQLVTPG